MSSSQLTNSIIFQRGGSTTNQETIQNIFFCHGFQHCDGDHVGSGSYQEFPNHMVGLKPFPAEKFEATKKDAETV
jgi:hypothetical protein